jgi:TolA-binding protein
MRWSSDTAALGRVGTPPVYAGAPVRAAARPADSLFVASMASYAAGAYERAERGLRAALAAGVDTVPVEFFRGASLLMLGRPREATVAFEHVIAAGPSAYVDEARYYRAKSLLAQGQHAAALIELRLLQRSPSDAAAAAGRLADSVEARLKR